MIQKESILDVADNSGAKKVKVIDVLYSKKNQAKIGDIVVISVQSATPNSSVKKKAVKKAVVVRSKKGVNRKNGVKITFNDNAVVILDSKLEPVGTRVFGSVTRELRGNENFRKILSLASEVI